jgi:hypothetical protein
MDPHDLHENPAQHRRAGADQAMSAVHTSAHLAPGTQVTVIATASGTTIVGDDAGRKWQLSRCCVSAGMLYQIGNEKRWRSTEDPAVVAELQRILALERARLATCDASTAVVVAKACEGLSAQLASSSGEYVG